MAGAAARIDQKSRALGSDASSFASKFVDVFVDVMSTTGDWPLTVTLSVSDATFISAFTVAVKPRPTRMPSCVTVEKPASSYLIWESPGGIAGNRKGPSSPHTAVRRPSPEGLAIVIVTPGMMPPLESLTLPLIAPVVAPTVCADDGREAIAMKPTITNRILSRLMVSPSTKGCRVISSWIRPENQRKKPGSMATRYTVGRLDAIGF